MPWNYQQTGFKSEQYLTGERWVQTGAFSWQGYYVPIYSTRQTPLYQWVFSASSELQYLFDRDYSILPDSVRGEYFKLYELWKNNDHRLRLSQAVISAFDLFPTLRKICENYFQYGKLTNEMNGVYDPNATESLLPLENKIIPAINLYTSARKIIWDIDFFSFITYYYYLQTEFNFSISDLDLYNTVYEGPYLSSAVTSTLKMGAVGEIALRSTIIIPKAFYRLSNYSGFMFGYYSKNILPFLGLPIILNPIPSEKIKIISEIGSRYYADLTDRNAQYQVALDSAQIELSGQLENIRSSNKLLQDTINSYSTRLAEAQMSSMQLGINVAGLLNV